MGIVSSPQSAVSTLSFAFIVLLAGCGGVGVEAPTQTATIDSPRETAIPTATQSPTATISPGCLEYVDPQFTFGDWGPSTVRVGYGIPANTRAIIAVYENETLLGLDFVTDRSGRDVDGHPVDLTTQLEGNHTIRIEAYEDTNDNHVFDPAIDESCGVETEPIHENFSKWAENST